MSKKLLVVLIAGLVLTSITIPTGRTKADEDPVKDVIASLPSEQPYQVVSMRVTAYSSSPDETDDTPDYTASGSKTRDGVVASNLFPFGTKIKIPALFGNKVFTVEDRMAKRFQKTVDVWMSSKEKAIYFGLKDAKVVVLSTTSLISYNPPIVKRALVVDKDKNLSINFK